MFNLTPPICDMKIGISYLHIVKYGTAYLLFHLTATSQNEQTNKWSCDLLISSQTVFWHYIRKSTRKGRRSTKWWCFVHYDFHIEVRLGGWDTEGPQAPT